MEIDTDEILSDVEKRKIVSLLPRLEIISCSINCSCCTCGDVLLYNWRLPCQHFICGNCHRSLKRSPYIKHYCYIDGLSFKLNELSRNLEVEKEIARMRTFCLNRNLGCPATPTLKTAAQHIGNCPILKERIQKKIKQTTNFPTSAEFAQKWEEFIKPFKIQDSKDDVPGPSIVPLPDDEEETIDSDGEQFYSCLKKLYEGTDELVLPDAINDATDDNGVLQESSVQFKVGSDSEEVKIISTRKSKEAHIIWEIHGFKHKANLGHIESKWYQLAGNYQCECKLKFNINQDHVLPLLIFKENSQSKLMRYHRKTLTINDLSKAKRNIERIEEPCFGSNGWYLDGIESFQPIPLKLLQSNSYVKDDMLKVQVILEPIPQLCSKILTKDCRFEKNSTLVQFKWSIGSLINKIALAKDGVNSCVARSSYFQSSPQGYRMQATLHIRDTWIAVYLDFLIGNWDDQLFEHFPHKTFFALTSSDKKGKCIAAGSYIDEEGHMFGDRIENFVPLQIIENLSLKDNPSFQIKINVEKMDGA